MKNSLSIITISFKLKDESQAKTIEPLFNKIKPIINDIPFIKKYIEKKEIDYFLYVEGVKISIDIVINNVKSHKKFQDMSIDFSEFQNFNIFLRSILTGDGFFDNDIDQFLEKSLSFDLNLEASIINAKYLIEALKITYDIVSAENEEEEEEKDLDINDIISIEYHREQRVKRIKKNIKFIMDVFSICIDTNLTFQFNPKHLSNFILDDEDNLLRKQGNEIFTIGKQLIKEYGGETSKGVLEKFEVYETSKILDIDEISITLLSSKYKNGIYAVVYLPGVTKYIIDNFFSA